MTSPRDYEIGYGKPPVATRFQKGQSGNPNGRKKGSTNLATVVNRVLRETIVVIDRNGKRRSISKFEATITGLVNRAVKGDSRATQQFLQDLAPLFGVDESAGRRTLDPNEAAAMAGLLERLTAKPIKAGTP